MLMYVPATTPVRAGQPISLNVGAISGREFGRVGAGPIQATIVRVDRGKMTASGHVGIGVKFAAV